jgi:hypothetical protein
VLLYSDRFLVIAGLIEVRGRTKKAPKEIEISLEPSYWVFLENPFNKPSQKQVFGLLTYGQENDEVKVSKSPNLVNNKIEECVTQGDMSPWVTHLLGRKNEQELS